jgi:hypothetical protein
VRLLGDRRGIGLGLNVPQGLRSVGERVAGMTMEASHSAPTSHFPSVRLTEEHPQAPTAIMAPSPNTFVTSADFMSCTSRTLGPSNTPRDWASRYLRPPRLYECSNSPSPSEPPRLAPENPVLILGGATSVGLYAIQFAKLSRLVCHRHGLATKLRPRSLAGRRSRG